MERAVVPAALLSARPVLPCLLRHDLSLGRDTADIAEGVWRGEGRGGALGGDCSGWWVLYTWNHRKLRCGGVGLLSGEDRQSWCRALVSHIRRKQQGQCPGDHSDERRRTADGREHGQLLARQQRSVCGEGDGRWR